MTTRFAQSSCSPSSACVRSGDVEVGVIVAVGRSALASEDAVDGDVRSAPL
jgi:hypothetical protein